MTDKEEIIDNEEKNSKLNNDNKKISFPVYALEIIVDIGFGIFMGLTVNFLANYIISLLGLNGYAVFIVQLFLITVVLYFIKIDTRYLYSTRNGEATYGIIFITVFFSVQKNMANFFTKIQSKTEK